MITTQRKNSVRYARKNGKIMTIKLFGRKYRLRESARIKYEILGYVIGMLLMIISFYMLYAALAFTVQP